MVFDSHKDCQHIIVNVRVPQRIEDREQDQSHGTHNRSQYGHDTASLLDLGSVMRQSAPVSQPSLGDEGKVEDDDSDGTTGNEQGLETLRADVGDICDVLAGLHACVMRASFYDPGREHGEEGRCAGVSRAI